MHDVCIEYMYDFPSTLINFRIYGKSQK